MWDLIVSVSDHCLSFYFGEGVPSDTGTLQFSNGRLFCSFALSLFSFK